MADSYPEVKKLADEARRQGMVRLQLLCDAVTEEDPTLAAMAIEHHGRPGMADLVEFLAEVPRGYGLKASIDYVLGYPVVGTAVSEEEETELREWNGFSKRALDIRRRMDLPANSNFGMSEDDLERSVKGLVVRVAHVLAEKHERALEMSPDRFTGFSGRESGRRAPFTLSREESEAIQRESDIKRQIYETDGEEALKVYEEGGMGALVDWHQNQKQTGVPTV